MYLKIEYNFKALIIKLEVVGLEKTILSERWGSYQIAAKI